MKDFHKIELIKDVAAFIDTDYSMSESECFERAETIVNAYEEVNGYDPNTTLHEVVEWCKEINK